MPYTEEEKQAMIAAYKARHEARMKRARETLERSKALTAQINELLAQHDAIMGIAKCLAWA
jgi:hypothetical protein